MKKICVPICIAFLISFSLPVNAQVEEVTREAEKKINEGIGRIFGKKKKKDEPKKEQTTKEQESTTSQESTAENTQEELKAWSKYDFVPGDVIIFEDNQENEENGEFPSKWDLKQGNVEIAKYGDEYVINFATTHNCQIVPLMDEQGDYLPDQFTLEFDAYFSEFCTTYKILFFDVVSQKRPSSMPFVSVRATYVSVEGFGGTDTDVSDSDYPFWKHISISFNVRALKVYFGEKRVNNIPNLRAQPMGITIQSSQCHEGKQALIKNIRIARGSKKLYDRVVTDGKIVTTGIKFDSGKATIKPESAGTLKKIYNLMVDHPDLNFSVEGHTDNVGDDDFNLKLSEKRAQSVKDELVKRGISADRLTVKGWGESKPLHANNTPEGKANNRRVEFVKL